MTMNLGLRRATVLAVVSAALVLACGLATHTTAYHGGGDVAGRTWSQCPPPPSV